MSDENRKLHVRSWFVLLLCNVQKLGLPIETFGRGVSNEVNGNVITTYEYFAFKHGKKSKSHLVPIDEFAPWLRSRICLNWTIRKTLQMKKLSYTKEISASPERVHDAMLGLSDKRTYEKWTAEFNPTSTWEGGWNKGDKILFVGIAEDGSKGGMVSRIAENEPGKYVSIEHYGILEKGVEITEGEKVDPWKGIRENYSFEATANGTRVTAELDSAEEYASYFDETWPKALDVLKEMCEQR